jgi:hypothetical protein
MPHRTLSTLLAILATTAGVAALADAAQAGIVATTSGAVVDNDEFPDLLQDSEVTLTDGNVAFRWANAVVTPELTATLHIVNGDDACYRTRTDSLDSAGNLIGSAYDEQAGHCRHSDAATDIPVDMEASAAPNVRKVQVVLEKQGTGGNWRTKDTSSLTSLTTFADDVTILGGGIDVGGPNWVNGAPTGPATVTWAIDNAGALTATYTGNLHLKSFYPGSGRVVIRAINPLTGFQVGRTEGPPHTPADNAHHAYPDTLSVTSSSGANLQIAMQSLVTDPVTGASTWQDVGTQTVNVSQ